MLNGAQNKSMTRDTNTSLNKPRVTFQYVRSCNCGNQIVIILAVSHWEPTDSKQTALIKFPKNLLKFSWPIFVVTYAQDSLELLIAAQALTKMKTIVGEPPHRYSSVTIVTHAAGFDYREITKKIWQRRHNIANNI